jgi:hypothetical protein
MTLWLITRFWYSPAAVTVFQIALLSSTIGFALALFRSHGVPAWILWFAWALSAGSLVNGLMVVTLWKDILFSICILALTVLLLGLIKSRGAWLGNILFLATLVLVGAFTAIYRQNGPIVAFGSLAAPLLAYPRAWRRLAVVLACTVAVWLGIRGPLYNSLGVAKMPAWYTLQPTLSQIGLYVKAGALDSGPVLEPAELSLLEAIHPLTDGWRNFDCYHPLALLDWNDTKYALVDHDPGLVINSYLRLLRYNPGFILPELLRCKSIVWRITQPAGAEMYVESIGFDASGTAMSIIPDPNALGLQEHSWLPQLKQWLAGIYVATLAPQLVWLIWRPALYSLGLMAAVILAALRRKCWRHTLLCLPALLATTPYLVLPISPDFRYHYPAYLV